jgi:hypothetical protein
VTPSEIKLLDQRLFFDFANRGRERLLARFDHAFGKIPMGERAEQ